MSEALPEIEVICVDGRPGAKPWLSVVRCLELMPAGFFSAARILCPEKPADEETKGFDLQWTALRLGDIHAYSRFCIENLSEVVSGTHALVVQNDGYILHPDLWDPVWLQYDYIGAPWPLQLVGGDKRKRVGNGGFSLRSRRLLQECRNLEYQEGVAEDVQICQTQRHTLLFRDVVFAPVSVAGRFSVEWGNPAHPTFGFHGVTGRDGRLLLQ
jgi:hypothetical protein